MCSSSLTAIHLACESIRLGNCELAIAGGVNVSIHPQKYLILSQGKFLSSDGRCESFGEGGDGYVPGEGVGAILLKPLSKAIADKDHIYGVVKGSSVNHGGKTNGYTVPNPLAQADVIRRAYEEANIDPKTISYIEAHGTGTSLGDPIEINGLVRAIGNEWREAPCAIGSVKSNIGHLEAAAGIAAVTKVLLQLQYQTLVPSLHSETLNPNINFASLPFKVQREVSEWVASSIEGGNIKSTYPRRAGISSFGAGGSNAHLIIEEAPVISYPETVVKPCYLLTLSAKTENAVKQKTSDLELWFTEQTKELHLEEMSYTLNVGRSHFEKRCAMVVSSIEELKETLQQLKENKKPTNSFLGIEKKEIIEDQAIFKELFKQLLQDIAKIEKCSSIEYREKLCALANFYVKGYDLNWERLHQGEAKRRIPLPTYPFVKERYWINEVKTLQSISTVASLHPLLDTNVSTLEQP